MKVFEITINGKDFFIENMFDEGNLIIFRRLGLGIISYGFNLEQPNPLDSWHRNEWNEHPEYQEVVARFNKLKAFC